MPAQTGKFTFHYGRIKRNEKIRIQRFEKIFTFHYGRIKSHFKTPKNKVFETPEIRFLYVGL